MKACRTSAKGRQSAHPGGKGCGRFGAVVAALGPADDRASLMVMEDELGRPSRQRRYPSSSHRAKARWGACR
jgi:hypothetical protein